MERIWLKDYPPGVPADIDPSRWPSLVAMIEESLAQFSHQPAFICMGRTVTYAELDELSRAFAAWLQGAGLKPGARIALMMPNVLQYAVAIAGALRAGLIVVNVNPLYTPRELEFQLQDSGAEAIVVLENFAVTVEKALPHSPLKHVVVARMGDLLGAIKGALVNLVVRHVKKMVPAYNLPQATAFADAIATGAHMDFVKPEIAPEDVAFIQYTGGTTGVAKGAALTHRNLIANTLQTEAWQKPMLAKEPQVKHLRIVAALPLYHIFALTFCYFAALRMGSVSLLIPNPRDLPSLIKELRGFKVNSFPGVNTLYNALLHHRDFKQVDWSALKCTIGGGMAVQRVVAERWLQETGCPLLEGYGLSECSPVLTCTRGDSTKWTGTIGLPISSTEIAIRDNDIDLPLGEAGEICARGPQVMAGYWHRPDETAKVMSADGFFRTGDIGVMDEKGEVRIVDRKKDMIVVSGFKVFPNEVEAVACSHPGVLECAVVGIPDEHTGETVKLFVVKKDPNLTAEELRKFSATQLTGYKMPRSIEFRAELPKSNVGKILRRALRDEALQQKPQAAMSMTTAAIATPQAVLDFWFGLDPEKWYKKDDAFDAAIREQFLATYEAAAGGQLSDWEQTPESTLALLIVLDQFPRNMFRGSPRSFAADSLALAIAKRAVERGFDRTLDVQKRTFVYLPYEHSENLDDQERGVALIRAAGDQESLKWAELHADIIRRFGRFPHRNAVLGRGTTAQEQAFLDAGGFAG
jgi:long-chain acyl-CoA synthetase